MSYLVYFYTLLTIVAFALAVKINKRWKSVVLNSFVLTVLILVAVLLIFKLPYGSYMEGNAPLNNLLGVSIVALAIPLYEQLRQIRNYWQIILTTTVAASVLSMLSGGIFALLLGAQPDIVATVLPKSVTTPIAMAVSENLGGIPSVAAVGVVVAGLQGSIFGYLLLTKIGLKNKEAIGLSVGAVSHALGTVSCMENDKKAGSYSSISLVLCGIISSILAPLIFKLIYTLV
ncbi:CidB/LrgB family autolysis modulator [Aggregatibacter actinomycetemcomitans]|uniref:CidB/LrgB family autolysis modulator n=1 Tax=Aggregatibacter actinomycetemcomitans TaxID=714 RepID=UPI0011DD064E|nr:CidB/LrgB family autolysis modulator [Aggregatibacter actinomycetemcomitans]QEH45680.1 CidB/LrgB family autolysis modulator [Aggregatibacter actinomycetemcomitans]QEH49414.1 CidB/LrgB family autolysis modulator [Aggregatibacter actinomycetemcomitans]